MNEVKNTMEASTAHLIKQKEKNLKLEERVLHIMNRKKKK